MLPVGLDNRQLPYASGLILCALDELRGAFLANYSPGARNRLAGRLTSAYAVLLIACAAKGRFFFLPGAEAGLASLNADEDALGKGEKRMVQATDTSKDALR